MWLRGAEDFVALTQTVETASSFASLGLAEALKRGLTAKGFVTPTPIQAQAIPPMLEGRDLLGIAQTGTGKTGAFVLPILNEFVAHPERPTRCQTRSLILAPTRELALQISNEFRKFKQIGKFKTCCLIGGMSREKQLRILEKGSHIVIATVGRLLDLIQNEETSSLKRLGMAKFLVIDEVDRLIELGQFKELKEVLKFMDHNFSKEKKAQALPVENKKEKPPKAEEIELTPDELIKLIESQVENQDGSEFVEIAGQKIQINDEFTLEKRDHLTPDEIRKIQHAKKTRKTYLFSATLTQISWTSRMLNNKKLLSSMKAMKNNKQFKHLEGTKEYPKIFDIMRKIRTNYRLEIVNCTKSEEEVFPEQMEIVKVKCIAQEKMMHLYYFLEQDKFEKNIVFCNSVRSSRQVLNILGYCGLKVLGLHSHMQQRQRIKKVEQFQKSKERVVLVTTDVASRGLHVEGVGLVVHFHTPRDYDTFVHRSGRTARMGQAGKVVLLEDSHDRKRYAKFQKDVVHKALKNIGFGLMYFF